ncbi:N-acetylglucosamine-6-phosphate 2-epimerase and phosphatase [Pseudoalteromonas sp. BSi20311]|uniref:UDP-N-acetylglucosamine 2-epimerase n=1 Tax=Pseudoalteromonas sp. BSi20311 TaxID=383911 RepID=UPI000231A71B|nr:UDP-N-acetylglucosamine 2-epimerase [Pseudoalteromonas sp. BSi20311]GAA65005.1 N-acetylglucosamine-6-phosphate 2-epimerase and phosphatase [Pseudoalteromonas sp. BSi20311]
MKILALTSIRSEYDLMSPLFFQLKDDPDTQLKLLVGGAHNSPTFGYTCKNIIDDGFEILLEVESLLDTNSGSGRLKSASLLLLSSIDIVKSFSPDLIIYAGDREEVMIGALLGGYLGIPTLHLYGGDHAADGHIDNPIRHAVSKLSTCHFVSTEEHKQRLLQLREPEYRIFNIGSIALDKFRLVETKSNIIDEVAKKKINKPAAIFIYHPIESEITNSHSIVENTIISVIEKGYHCFVGLPNSDPGNNQIRNVIKTLANKNSNITVYGNLSREDFVSLFKSSSLIIGNSSAGLLEAASVPIPCINVGERQFGRACGCNVVFVKAQICSIKNALDTVSSKEFKENIRKMVNPYGDGFSANKAYSLIKTIDFKKMLAKKEDPLCD